MRLLVASAIILLAMSPTAKQQQEHSTSQNPTAEKAVTQTSPVTVVVNEPSANKREDSLKAKSHDWYDIIAVGLAIVAAIIGIRSLHHLKQQAVWTEKAAKTAIASECAWIDAELRWPNLKGNIIHGTSVIERQEFKTTWFTVDYVRRNSGKTPAWITETNLGIQIADTLPPRPDMKTTWPFQSGIEVVSAGGESTLERLQLQVEGHYEIGKITILYGFIKYRDVFGRDDRITTFGYYMKPDRGFERLNLPGWNEHT
jgi:hypothetical protein